MALSVTQTAREHEGQQIRSEMAQRAAKDALWLALYLTEQAGWRDVSNDLLRAYEHVLARVRAGEDRDSHAKAA